MAETDVQSKKLSEYFDEVWKIYEFLERCDEPTVSDKVQVGFSETVSDLQSKTRPYTLKTPPRGCQASGSGAWDPYQFCYD